MYNDFVTDSSCFPTTYATGNATNNIKDKIWIFSNLTFKCNAYISSLSFFGSKVGAFYLGIWTFESEAVYNLNSTIYLYSNGYGLQNKSFDESNRPNVFNGAVLGVHGNDTGTKLPLYFVSTSQVANTAYTEEDLSLSYKKNKGHGDLSVGSNLTLNLDNTNRLPSIEITLITGEYRMLAHVELRH